MRVWFASFLLLFALAQLFQWMKQFSVPLPVFILGGLFLAIASNYDKRSGWPFRNKPSELEASKTQTSIVTDSINLPQSQPVSSFPGQQVDRT